jgi:DNA polymerase-1
LAGKHDRLANWYDDGFPVCRWWQWVVLPIQDLRMIEARKLPAPQESVEKRLVLIDGMALIYRAHFALIRSPRYTSSGKCTSATFGFCNTLIDVLNRQRPTHLAVAFDTDEPTHRHERFEQYKAQRQAMPEDLAEQLPDVLRLLQAMRIPILRMPGWEADDVLGTLARRAERDGFVTYLVTPDKDYQQLVTDKTFVWKPGRQGGQFEVLGVEEVKQRWQVSDVSQVVDVLGLMGDTSDNVPGVPGIGQKTAQQLIAEFGSTENLLANLDKLKGKRREVLESHAEQACLSKELVTIDTNVPVQVQWPELERQAWDVDELRRLFTELEFSTLGRRLLGDDFAAGAPAAAAAPRTSLPPDQGMLFAEPQTYKTLRDVPHNYQLVTTARQRAALLAELQRQPAFCFDLETTSLDPRIARPLGIAFCFQPQQAYYVVCPTDPSQLRQILLEIAPIWSNTNVEKIGHNLKYDVTVLKWQGIDVEPPIRDSMLVHSMVEPDLKHGLDFLASRYLGYQPITLKSLLGDPPVREMSDIPLEQLAEYSCEDADIAWQLAMALEPIVIERGAEQVCYQVECPLIRVLVDMEYEGIRVDTQALRRYSEQLAQEIVALRTQIFAAAGREFNIDSPKQLGEVLYDELKLEDRPRKTATGQHSTREAELLRLAGRHSIVRDVLEYRNAVKLKSVYVDQLPAAVDPRTGRIHTSYSQAWTATGRMQSGNPNLQTIPIRKERGREIRAAFVPRDENYLLLSADYSQIELRIMAALSQDAGMIEAFRSGTDIHVATAAKVYKVELDNVTRQMRDAAKTVNFGIIYGISAFGLQQRLNIPRQEAAGLIENYFDKYPGVRSYIDRTLEFARKHGYVQTLTGRRRYLRDINSRNFSVRGTAERLAMNSPIQGTAADMLKLAMIKVHGLLREGNFRTKMLLTVHDEIVFDLYKSEQSQVMPLIREAMQNALPLNVPVVVEMGVGENWLDAH